MKCWQSHEVLEPLQVPHRGCQEWAWLAKCVEAVSSGPLALVWSCGTDMAATCPRWPFSGKGAMDLVDNLKDIYYMVVCVCFENTICFERYQHLSFSLIPNLLQLYLDCALYVCILYVRSCSFLVTLSAIQFLFCAYCLSSSAKLYLLKEWPCAILSNTFVYIHVHNCLALNSCLFWWLGPITVMTWHFLRHIQFPEFSGGEAVDFSDQDWLRWDTEVSCMCLEIIFL